MEYSEIQSHVRQAINLIREANPKFDRTFNGAEAAKSFCELKLHGAERELFLVLFLNSQHQLISDEIMFKGTVNAAAVYPREIAKRALELNAAAIILSHNHPSGVTTPSQADLGITKRIQNCMEYLDIDVLDHIIVGHESMSFSQQGLM